MLHSTRLQLVIVAAAWLWTLWALPELSNAGTDGMLVMMFLFSAGAIGLAWTCCFAAVTFTPSRARRFHPLFWSPPVLAASILCLSCTDAPLQARLWLCESTLREHAEVYRQNPALAERPIRQIGLFEVQSVFAQDDQVAFRTGTGFFCDYGIVYRPDGAKPVDHRFSLGSRNYHHLYGPWWRYHEYSD